MLKRIYLFSCIFILSLSLKSNDEYIFGMGASFVSYPSYIGSKKQNNLLIPFPYIKYSNKYINIDRDKIYNEFYNSEKTKVEISLRGMLPSKSDDTAREGMPNLDGVLDEIDTIIGLDRVKAIHLNDNKNEIASYKDRHEIIGDGTIGLSGIVNIINNERLKDIPFNLETPNEVEGHKREIEMLKDAYRY